MTHDETLLLDAKQAKIEDKDLAACWSLVVRAIEVGWIDRAELAEILTHLLAKRDYGVQELNMEYVGDAFAVSFLSEKYECAPEDFCELLQSLLSSAHPGTITFMEEDRVVSVRKIEEVPESARFANTPSGPVPIVKVVMRMMGSKAREIVEYGPGDQRLRSTLQHKR